jgi:hypothetical protein
LAVLFLSSCDSITDGRKGDDFRENRNLWQQKGIENYTFEYSKLCYCGGLFNPATIVVKADTIHAVLDPDTGEPLRDPQTDELVLQKYPESFLTIDELFGVIENARKKADKLNVEYDQNSGYPTYTEIDYIKEAIDDEVTYKVNNFEAS